jgi:hypothetical protein
MKWPLDKNHIPKDFGKPGCGGVALRAAALSRQQDDWKIGPGRLPLQKHSERPQIGAVDRLVGYDRQASTFIEFLTEAGKIGTYFSWKARFHQDQRCDLTVAPIRRQNNCALRKWT